MKALLRTNPAGYTSSVDDPLHRNLGYVSASISYPMTDTTPIHTSTLAVTLAMLTPVPK